MSIDNIQIYLPKYLSAESTKELYEELKNFPDNIDKRLYTSYLRDMHIYQGDCIKDLLVIDLPNTTIKQSNCIVLSNSCDIEIANKRLFPSQIVYAPIIDLERYLKGLSGVIGDMEKISNHEKSIRKQEITQIFFLPKYGSELNDSIVFLDRIYNIKNDYINRDDLPAIRLFSLSNYGHYLFLLKLSLHLTRIQERIDRKSDFLSE